MERKGVSVDGVAVHVGIAGVGNIGRAGVPSVFMFSRHEFVFVEVMALVNFFEGELFNDGAHTL